MTTSEHSIYRVKRRFSETELDVREEGDRFSLQIGTGFDYDKLDGLTIKELGAIAFRLLEVVSYYDPDFKETLEKASDWTKRELRRAMK